MKDKIRPYYEELKGLREALPEEGWFEDDGISNKYLKTLEGIATLLPELNRDEYILKPEWSEDQFGGGGRSMITKNQYKTILNALIGHLKGLFDFDNNQNNSGHTFIQSQSVSIELVLNLQEKIINLENKYEEGTPEKTFLKKLKNSLSSIKDATDIIKIVLSEAQKAGITLNTLITMFC